VCVYGMKVNECARVHGMKVNECARVHGMKVNERQTRVHACTCASKPVLSAKGYEFC